MFARIAKFFRKSAAPVAPVAPAVSVGIDSIIERGGRLGFGSTNSSAYAPVETKAYDSGSFLGRTGFGGRVDY